MMAIAGLRKNSKSFFAAPIHLGKGEQAHILPFEA